MAVERIYRNHIQSVSMAPAVDLWRFEWWGAEDGDCDANRIIAVETVVYRRYSRVDLGHFLPVLPPSHREALEDGWHYEGQEVETGWVFVDVEYGPIGTVTGEVLLSTPSRWRMWHGTDEDERRSDLALFQAMCRRIAAEAKGKA